MDKLEYERRTDELYAQYDGAKRANEQNPVREQRSKALKEARKNYERKQNVLNAEYETANPAAQTEVTSKSSEKSGSIDWSWLWWLILIILMAGGRGYFNSLEREEQQDDPPAETLPQEEHR
jgi:hypothetical protein